MDAENPSITLDPNVLTGKLVIRGTRLSVESVIWLLADGWSEVDILDNYPGMTHEHILACLSYARDSLSSENVFPSPTRHAVPGGRKLSRRGGRGTSELRA